MSYIRDLTIYLFLFTLWAGTFIWPNSLGSAIAHVVKAYNAEMMK